MTSSTAFRRAAARAHRLPTFLRSLLAGSAATLADLLVLGAAVSLGASARAANVPALLVGAAVQFVANRRFAFRAEGGSIGRQAALFAASEAIALTLNGLLYDAAARVVPAGPLAAVAARAVTTNLVFLLWSYPVWRRVFRAPPAPRLPVS